MGAGDLGPVCRLDPGRVAELRAAPLTYPEVGASRDPVLPDGYRTFRRHRLLPPGTDFARAADILGAWGVQRRAGLRVAASGPVAAGAVVDLRAPGLPGRWPCRVVWADRDDDRCGFGYGTLPGHLESGEESFRLERTPDGRVTMTVAAFSQPATRAARWAGPLGRRLQDAVTWRYLRTLDG